MSARALLALLLALAAAAARADEAPQLRIESGSHHASIRQLATDARGDTLLTVAEDKTARLWRLADQRLRQVLRPPIGPGNEGKLFAAALSPDGRVAAVAGWSADNEVYLFDASEAGGGAMLGRIAGLPNVVNHLQFAPDGRSLAVLLWGGHGLQIHASADGWRTARLAGGDPAYGGDAYGADFSADGRRLVTSAYDGQLRLYELRGGAPWLLRRAATVDARLPHGVRFAPDGRRIAVGFADQPRVAVLHADTLERAAWTPPADGLAGGGLHGVAWSSDGTLLYAGGSWRSAPGRHGVRRWRVDADGGGAPEQLDLAADSITALLRLPDGHIAYAAADAGWGLIAARGAPAQRPAQRADLRALVPGGGLRISADARQLEFAHRFGGAEPARFDLDGLTWRTPAATLAPPTPASGALELRDWQDSAAPLVNGRAVALEAGELALTAASDARAAALGSNFALRLVDRDARPLWRAAVPAPCFAVRLSENGHWVVAGFGDGTIRWFRRDDGAEALAFYPHGDRLGWALWTPDGRYAAGHGGDRQVGWHLNRGPDRAAEFLPLARFAERYFDPLAVVSAATGAPAPARPLPDPRRGLALPPVVRITDPKVGRPVGETEVRVEVSVQDRGGGIDEVRLLHNGKVVETNRPTPGAGGSNVAGGAPLQLRFALALEAGSNQLRVVAFGRDRTESAADELVLFASAPPGRPQLQVLAVGVNRYRNALLDLSFSVPDARGVAALFRNVGKRLFRDVVVTELYDADATRARIRTRLGELRATHPEDVVVVYLAGHGDTVDDDWFFIPHELTQPERSDMLRRDGLSSRELAEALKAMPARKVVVLIDACKSGAAVGGFRGLEERRLLAQLSRASGTHLIAATTKEQLAAELHALGHGVFTYALLEGLGGKAATDGRDITARKLMVYVEQALPELSKRYRAEEQFPVVNSTGMDFPLIAR